MPLYPPVSYVDDVVNGRYGTQFNQPRASDLGALKSWNYDVANSTTTSAAPVTGTLYVAKCPLRSPTLLTGARLVVSTSAGLGTTAEIGLFTADGTRRALSANEAAAFQTGGVKSINFGAAYTPAAPLDFVWVSMLFVGALLPNLVRASGVSVNVLNPGQALTAARWGIAATTQTETPSTITLGNIVTAAVGEGFWCGLF